MAEKACRACNKAPRAPGSRYCYPCGDEVAEMMSEFDREHEDDGQDHEPWNPEHEDVGGEA